MKKIANRAFIIPIFETVIFPGMETKVKVDTTLGEKIEAGLAGSETDVIALTVIEGSRKRQLRKEDFYQTGTLLSITGVEKIENGYHLSIRGGDKALLEEITVEEKLFVGSYSVAAEVLDSSAIEQTALLAQIKKEIVEIGKNFRGSETFMRFIEQINSIDDVIRAVLPLMNVTIPEKQELLETPSQRSKFLAFIDLLMKQKERIDLQVEMANRASEKTSKQYREHMLREQMRMIQDELNEGDESVTSVDGYRERIEASDMPEDVRRVALAELRKLETSGQQNSEAHVIRNYLDLLLDLPWSTEETREIDLETARGVLDGDHYGLEKVKERIIQHLAVMKLKKEKQGSILLLVGPPGTGKTSLGKSISSALDRKYVRASLGGVRDEAEIRGHRRTYVGALPGRIINGIKKAGARNPVFVLDEIDKLMASYSGDPASALLEVLDPEQNSSFSDHYLEVPYDLSEVFFIATANSLSSIPAPLLDRMEVIEISSYTNSEKLHIAEDHLFPEVLEEHGLGEERLVIEKEAFRAVIDRYTREAGVRGLKKQITKIARVASEKIVSGNVDFPFVVKEEMLQDILGRELVRHDQAKKENIPGVVTGLAWTPVGGEILFIETTAMKGKGGLTLTGQLGEVMKESATISMSLIRSRLAHLVTGFDFAGMDTHIHVPSGSTPKDGPSAGIALFTALVSLVTGKRVDSRFAMTGEITLRGEVLPVGGIKEKVLGAHRAGIKTILLPRENVKDLEDVPQEVQEDLKFIPVETVEEVIRETVGIELPKHEFIFMKEGFSGLDSSIPV